ncbi:MAG: hypothetical protein KAX49_05840 [Halanaerobiales bacterium]|nr:hypothetical protein [Halanaerobiales bacterium]
MNFTIENIIIFLSASYITVRVSLEVYYIAKKKYIQDYLPLKKARKYRQNKEIYHYHLFHYSQKMINAQNFKRAEKYLNEILTENPDYPLANYMIGITLIEQKQFSKSKDHFQKEIEISPDHSLAYFFLSKSYTKLKDYIKALESLKRSLEINPYYYQGYLLGLEIFSHLKVEPKTELEFYQGALKFQCITSPIWIRIKELEETFLSPEEIIERKKFYDSLEENWQKAMKQKNKILRAIAEQRFFQAENLLIDTIRYNPHDNQLYLIYNQVLLTQKKFPQVLDFYVNHMQRINPDPFGSYLRLTDYLVYNKKHKEALEIMLEIFHKYPSTKFLHYPLSMLYNWLEQPEKVIHHLQKAIYFDKSVKELAKKNPDFEKLKVREDFKKLII